MVRLIVMALLSTVLGIANASLITNPGFEDGVTGWVFSDGDGTDGADVGTCETPCVFAHSGSWAGFKNFFDGGAGTISQTIDTLIGTTYTVELWLADNSFEAGSITVSFGDTVGVSVTEEDTSLAYTHYSFLHTATSIATDFVFAGDVTSGTFFIDDISITPVPIPASLWLLGSAVGILMLRRPDSVRSYSWFR